MAVLVRCLGEPSLKVSKAVVGHRAHYLSLVKAVPRYPYRLRAVQQKKRNRSLSLPNRCRLGRAAVFRFLLAAATIHPISNEAPAIPLERLQMCSRFELAGKNSNTRGRGLRFEDFLPALSAHISRQI
jgi:hypothetical protein